MTRSPEASLSPQELASLRQIGSDPRQPIPGAHRQLLVSMQLIRSAAGCLAVTEDGSRRLREERQRSSKQRWDHPEARS